jgi:hypothetical protein
MANNNWVPPTPLPATELAKYEGEASKAQIKLYQEEIGSILYTAVMLRPDIAYAASQLSRSLTNPGPQHFKAAERVIRYLYHTRSLGIIYGDSEHSAQALVIAGDASFADDAETRRSSHGYVLSLFGGPIIWKATRQNTVSTSTTEAELLVLDHTAKETMALKRLFRDVQLDLSEAWTILSDNKQAIRLVVEDGIKISTQLKHVDIQNMWLRQEYSKGTFEVVYLPTDKMPADGLTKNLSRQGFEHFRSLLNMYDAHDLL